MDRLVVLTYLREQAIHQIFRRHRQSTLLEVENVQQRHFHQKAYGVHPGALAFVPAEGRSHLRHHLLEKRIEHTPASGVLHPIAEGRFAVQDAGQLQRGLQRDDLGATDIGR